MWTNFYTSGKKLKSTSQGRGLMTKGFKTPLQERIEFVQYTIAKNVNYHEATENIWSLTDKPIVKFVNIDKMCNRCGKILESSKQHLIEDEK